MLTKRKTSDHSSFSILEKNHEDYKEKNQPKRVSKLGTEDAEARWTAEPG